MKTCPSCFREHTGRGWLCPMCNNPKAIKRGDGRNNSGELMGELDAADCRERSERDGWWYDDGDD